MASHNEKGASPPDEPSPAPMTAEERERLGEVLVSHRPWLEASARRIVRDAELARELPQEAALRLLTHPPRDRDAGALGRLLAVTVRNLALNAVRRRAVETEESQARGADALARERRRLGRDDPTHEDAGRLEAERAVRALLSQLLSPLEEEAVTFVLLQQRTAAEAAVRLGKATHVVQGALARARRKLRARCVERLEALDDPSDFAAIFRCLAAPGRVLIRLEGADEAPDSAAIARPDLTTAYQAGDRRCQSA